jgi:hypothetical protein
MKRRIHASCVRRPLVNHSEPSLGEPSSPFIDSPYAPRQQDPYGLSALPLLRCHQPRDLVWLPSTRPSRFRSHRSLGGGARKSSTTSRGTNARTAGALASASTTASGACATTSGVPASASKTARGGTSICDHNSE